MDTKETPRKVAAFTYKSEGILNRLVSNLVISSGDQKLEGNGLWDTGATNSCISEFAADFLKLKPVSMGIIQTPSGNCIVNKYMVDVKLPGGVLIKNVCVSSSKIGEQVFNTKNPDTGETCVERLDFLIGMDIISKGDFTVSNCNGKTVYSFRAPSVAHTDYVQIINNSKPRINTQKTKPNEPCPCGSGKKYKNCCGKV